MLYSISGITLDDFKSTGKKFEATTGEWKEYTVDLPAGATYFAIHNNTADTYMFMIDDVTYTAGCGKVLGYNVYRDGKLLKRIAKGVKSLDGIARGFYIVNGKKVVRK